MPRRTKKRVSGPPHGFISKFNKEILADESKLAADLHERAIQVSAIVERLLEHARQGKPVSLAEAAEEAQVDLLEVMLAVNRASDDLVRLPIPPVFENETMKPSSEDLQGTWDYSYTVAYSEEPRRVLRLEVPDLPPRLPHKWAAVQTYGSIRERCYRLVENALRLAREHGAVLPSAPFASAVVIVVSHFADIRQRDTDNYAIKFFSDALVNAGLLQQDSYVCLPFVLAGIESDAPARTEIIVAEAVEQVRSLLGNLRNADAHRFTWNKVSGRWSHTRLSNEMRCPPYRGGQCGEGAPSQALKRVPNKS